MRSRIRPGLITSALALALLTGTAAAVDFTPTIEFALSDAQTKGNPELSVKVTQDSGEEELDSVQITVPAGFTLATDEQIPNGTQIGSGTITIHVGPRCRNPSAPLSAPANVGVRIVEQDRTPAEVAEGTVAVFVVDLQPVTTIPLKVKGSPTAGYTLSGNIPPNADTCPPFVFDARFFKTAAGNALFLNPASSGEYTFRARFVGLQGSVSEHQQSITIYGGKQVACSGKAPTIVGSDGKDVITGTKRGDVIQTLAGNDVVKGGGGNDRICAGKGNDKVKGDSGLDMLLGEGGNDRLIGGAGNRDTCSGGPGRDRVKTCERGR
jgi:RTX calcium-binding nonapeptide repeat (4 copies)